MQHGNAGSDRHQTQPDNLATFEPFLADALFQHILHGPEEHDDIENSSKVDPLQQIPLRFVDPHQQPGQQRYQQARQQIDEEQRLPGDEFRQIASKHRPCRGRDGDHQPDNDDHGRLQTRGKQGVDDREHRGNHGAAKQALQATKNDHGVEIPGQRATQTHERETGAGDSEQDPRGKRPPQPA